MDTKWMLSLPLAASLIAATAASAMTIEVAAGESIQAAIEAAADGDTVLVASGTFAEDLDFRGKDIGVVGAGATTVVRGSGNGPVVTFANGESPAAVLDSLTITGGVADRGGGVRVSLSSPTIVRCIIVDNRARQSGSGIDLFASNAELYNNLIAYNRNAGGDPHSVQINGGAPRLVNNTIVRGDSNGILVGGGGAPLILNNILAFNGSSASGLRGRGICDFSGGRAVIRHNVFYRNRIGALLTDGRDFRRIELAQTVVPPPRLESNRDGKPRFQRRPARRADRAHVPVDFALHRLGSRRAVDAGDPDPRYNDRDGTRNDAGFTGGPFAAPAS